MAMSARQTVMAFMDSWNTTFDELVTSFRRYMAPDSSWSQPGFPTTKNIEETVGLLNSAYQTHRISTIDTTLRHVVADSNTVIAERTDRVLSPEKQVIATLDVTGVFEVNDQGQITAWREYFDPTPLVALMKK
jgi:limonene-1,2-epoxide hydrolase